MHCKACCLSLWLIMCGPIVKMVGFFFFSQQKNTVAQLQEGTQVHVIDTANKALADSSLLVFHLGGSPGATKDCHRTKICSSSRNKNGAFFISRLLVQISRSSSTSTQNMCLIWYNSRINKV